MARRPIVSSNVCGFQSETFNDLNFWNANINYAGLIKEASKVEDAKEEKVQGEESSSNASDSNSSGYAANSPIRLREPRTGTNRGRHKSEYKFLSSKRRNESTRSDNGDRKFVFDREIIDLE